MFIVLFFNFSIDVLVFKIIGGNIIYFLSEIFKASGQDGGVGRHTVPPSKEGK